MRMYFENNKILFSNKEKKPDLLKKRLLFNLIKKSKKSLWQKVSKKRRQQFGKNSLEANKNLFFTDNKSLVEFQLKKNLLAFLPQYNAENTIHTLYQRYIQNNKMNEQAYLHFYNRLTAKIDILKIIDADHGKNIALNPDIVCKMLSLLTYSVGLLSSALFHAIAAITRHGINELSDIRKINSAKNKLNHWITDLNFIKLLSIMLTKTHEPDFAHQERMDYFLDEQFLIFWSLFKKQAKMDTEIPDLNDFWSTCLVEYVKELKCPLLKDNFEHCLNEMLASVNFNHPHQEYTQLPNTNASNQYKNFSTPSQESIFLAQWILQTVISHYLNRMLELNQTVKMHPNSSAFTSTFWHNENKNSRENFNPPSPAINSIFSPRLIASY